MPHGYLVWSADPETGHKFTAMVSVFPEGPVSYATLISIGTQQTIPFESKSYSVNLCEGKKWFRYRRGQIEEGVHRIGMKTNVVRLRESAENVGGG